MKEIPGYFGYYAGEDGFIYSNKSGVLRKLAVRRSSRHPYLMTGLYVEGRRKRIRLHKLILNAFVGPRPIGFEARHLDGDCLNNKPNNLSWGTRLENVNDKRKHGTIPVGERNGRSKLTKGQVSEIINLKGVMSTYRIAKIYGVGQTTISAIHSGRSWRLVS